MVKEPLVDLDPGETGFSDRLLLKILGELAVVLFEDAHENRNLRISFPTAIIVVGSCLFYLVIGSMLLASAFARNFVRSF